MNIKNIQLLYVNQTNRRQVKVTLSNGTVIRIIACYESFEQWGGTIDELKLTVDIAHHFNGWLHGKELK